MDADTRSALASVLAELDAEHRPGAVPDPETPYPGFKRPSVRGGCVMCWPKDGSWPCITRLVADELRALVEREDGDAFTPRQAAFLGRLIKHVLGYPGEDWRVERWDEEYEGWQASLVTPCDQKGCYCCDPKNLTREDADLLLALFPDAHSGGSGTDA